MLDQGHVHKSAEGGPRQDGHRNMRSGDGKGDAHIAIHVRYRRHLLDGHEDALFLYIMISRPCDCAPLPPPRRIPGLWEVKGYLQLSNFSLRGLCLVRDLEFWVLLFGGCSNLASQLMKVLRHPVRVLVRVGELVGLCNVLLVLHLQILPQVTCVGTIAVNIEADGGNVGHEIVSVPLVQITATWSVRPPRAQNDKNPTLLERTCVARYPQASRANRTDGF